MKVSDLLRVPRFLSGCSLLNQVCCPLKLLSFSSSYVSFYVVQQNELPGFLLSASITAPGFLKFLSPLLYAALLCGTAFLYLATLSSFSCKNRFKVLFPGT